MHCRLASIQAMSTANYLAFSFGRSGYDRVLNDFAVELATDLKLEPIDIHWLDLSGGENAFAQKSSTIKGASLILTDIYHLGINALRETN